MITFAALIFIILTLPFWLPIAFGLLILAVILAAFGLAILAIL